MPSTGVYMRMTVLLLSRIEAVIRPGAQPLLHCAKLILFEASVSMAFLLDCLRCFFSSRSHLQMSRHCHSHASTMYELALIYNKLLHMPYCAKLKCG